MKIYPKYKEGDRLKLTRKKRKFHVRVTKSICGVNYASNFYLPVLYNLYNLDTEKYEKRASEDSLEIDTLYYRDEKIKQIIYDSIDISDVKESGNRAQ